MRQFSFTMLSPEEFTAFSSTAPYGNFQQTTAAARLREGTGAEVAFTGVREDGRLVAAALVATTKSPLASFCTITDGPLVDFNDRELVDFYTAELKAYAKKQGAAHLDITPEMPYRLRDDHGKPLPVDTPGVSTEPNKRAVDNLKAAGWRHEGFTVGYTSVPRWRFLKDLTGIADERQLLASYSKRTQWSVKRAASMGVRVREIGAGELGIFATIEQETAERRHFAYRGEDYFHRFKEAYGDDAHFMVAEIHTGEYRDAMAARVAELDKLVGSLEAKLAQRETTKLRRRYNEEHSNLQAAQRRLESAEALAKRGDVLPAAASLFVTHPRETVYLFSGSVEEFKPFYASAYIQHVAMLKLCVERGVTRYNFYGIDGEFDDPDDEGRGVLEFKQGFNGYVEELMGEFMLVTRPGRYKLVQLAHRVTGR
ncbi:MAG: aminoacyltransferase [Bifidobacterium sp.]|nr:aminoacyltransferase [Bifidobacterium sp.]